MIEINQLTDEKLKTQRGCVTNPVIQPTNSRTKRSLATHIRLQNSPSLIKPKTSCSQGGSSQDCCDSCWGQSNFSSPTRAQRGHHSSVRMSSSHRTPNHQPPHFVSPLRKCSQESALPNYSLPLTFPIPPLSYHNRGQGSSCFLAPKASSSQWLTREREKTQLYSLEAQADWLLPRELYRA